jgi:putative ABC transport system substrate-binding protein
MLALAAGALTAWRPASRAQPAKVARIGLLSPFSPSDATRWHQAFREGLRELGWVEGKDITIEYRYANGNTERLPQLTADLVRLKVDVIVTSVTNDALAAKDATRSIPIVMAAAGDPVATGLVANLARPGSNITGLSQMNRELMGKRLELLKEIAPRLSRVAVMWNPEDPISAVSWQEMQLPSRQLGLELLSLEVRSASDFPKAFEQTLSGRAGALAILPNPVFVTNLKRIADFAAKNRLPSMFHLREFADAGGLIAYGVDRPDLFRRAAVYVDKILKGAKPGDLPIEQPTRLSLVINRRTAKAIGLTIPQELVLRADRVIE